MAERWKLDIDFRNVLSGLETGERVRGVDALGASEETFLAREHSYRRIDDFTLLHVLNFEVGEPYSLRMARPDLICLQATVSGSYNRWIGERMDLVSPQMLEISNMPYSSVSAKEGCRLRGVLIVCDRHHLIEHYRLNVSRLAPPYQPIFLSHEGAPDILKLPLSPIGLHLIDQILTCKYPEPLRGIFTGAKTVEFLCNVVAQLNSVAGHAAPRPSATRQKSLAIQAAAEIYRREIGQPPTIEQLALRVGLNRNELTGGFRETFGVTPHVFARTRRMERAQELLHSGTLTISEIARRVGYEGYSGFSRAYQAHYGRAPTIREPETSDMTDE